jgi:hypothetical protein
MQLKVMKMQNPFRAAKVERTHDRAAVRHLRHVRVDAIDLYWRYVDLKL